MYQCEIISPDALTAQDRAAWLDLLRSAGLSSPLLHPDFARLAGGARADARVALFRDADGLAAVLAHHRRPDGFARPIGAVFSDCHALPAREDFAWPLARAIHAAGLRAFRFSALHAPSARVFAPAHGPHSALSAVLEGDPEAFLKARQRDHARKFKGLRRLTRRLEEDHGPVRLQSSRERADLDRLFDWKRAQFAASRRHDVLSPDWARRLMDALFEGRGGDVDGLLITLTAGDRMIAGEFGLRTGPVFHPWIAAYDAGFGRYSPGHLLVHRLIEAMPGLGLSRYDMGPGDEGYKRYFANRSTPVYAGTERAPVLRGKTAAAIEAGCAKALALCGPGVRRFAEKVHGRLDHIAAAEPDRLGRVRGLGRAAGAMFSSEN